MSSVVKVALPILGAIVGSVIPGLGTALGASLGGAVGGYIGGRSYGGGNAGGMLGALGGAAGGYMTGGYGASDWLGGLGSATGAAGEGAASTALGGMGTLGGGAATAAADTGVGASGGFVDAIGDGAASGMNPGFTDALGDSAAGGMNPAMQPNYSDMLATGQGGAGTSLTTTPNAPGYASGVAGEPMGASASALNADGTPMSPLDRFRQAMQSKGAVRGGINVATGLLGLAEANSLRKAADPFAKYRAGYGAELADLQAHPERLTTMPGYSAGLQAVQRAGAAQGYTGSGNMNAALAGYGQNFFNTQSDRLATLAGAGAPVGQGATAGYVADNNAWRGIGTGLGSFFGG